MQDREKVKAESKKLNTPIMLPGVDYEVRLKQKSLTFL
jgi:hypothetical protein